MHPLPGKSNYTKINDRNSAGEFKIRSPIPYSIMYLYRCLRTRPRYKFLLLSKTFFVVPEDFKPFAPELRTVPNTWPITGITPF